MTRWRALPFLAALVVAAPAAAANDALSIAGGEQTRSVTLSMSGTDEAGKLNVIVRNSGDAAGTLRLRFIDQEGNEVDVTTEARRLTPKPDALSVRLSRPKTLQIDAHDAILIEIRFTRRADVRGPAAGDLIVSLTGKAPAGPVVVPVKISKKETPPAKLQFDQDKATISLTRLYGPINDLLAGCTKCTVGESVDVSTRGRSPAQATATLHSESGGNATIKLERKSNSRSKLRVTKINRHGTYEGKLILDPEAAQPRTLAVDVKARDSLFWPLLAVLAGGAFGAGVLRRHENTRNRGNVQALIKMSVQPYVDARKGPNGETTRPDRFYLNDLLPDGDAPVFPSGSACENPDTLKPVPKLYCKAAKLNGKQSLADLLAEMKDVTARFDRWRKVEDAATTLASQINALPPHIKYDRISADANRLLVRSYREPDDDKVASELVLLFHAEAAVITTYVHARELFDNLPPAWRERHQNVDPNKDLDALTPAAARTCANAEEVALALLYKVEALKNPDSVPGDPQPDEQGAYMDDLGTYGVLAVLPNLSAQSQHVFLTSRRLGPNNADTRTPEQIRAAVRRSDWVIFVVTAVLTALVYLAGEYSDDWGSIEDYVFAIAAGAVAPTAITWSLIPYSRSYNPAAAPAAAPAE